MATTKPTPGVEKQTKRYTVKVARDGDGKYRRRKVMNKSDKTVWSEVVYDDS